MSDQDLFPVPAEWAKKARVNAAKYTEIYGRSLADPGTFWLEQAKRLDWIKRPEIAGDWSFDATTFHINWFADGTLNVSANCIDRHLAKRAKQTAIIWEADDPKTPAKHITYGELHDKVCRLANVLKAQNLALVHRDAPVNLPKVFTESDLVD